MIKKTVIIIGVSSDIGKKTAKVFAQNGYDIIGTYNHGKIDDVKISCESLNANFKAIKLDTTKFEDVEEAFKKISSLSEYLDCLVYLPGLSEKENLLCDYTKEQIEKIIDVNLKGAIFCNREAMKYMIKQKRGSIINMSSIYGVYGGACETAYSAAKAGIIGLTKALAQECGQFGVRVNAVAPGCIETKMTSCYSKEEKQEIAHNTPLGRLGQPEDVANAIYFLASDNASFITGEALNINGGATRF